MTRSGGHMRSSRPRNQTGLIVVGAMALLVATISSSCSDSTDEGPTPAVSTAGVSSRLCFDEGRPFRGEARLYIEHNATDEDTGVHGMFDQEGLAEGCIQTPDGEQVMLVDPTGRLDALGINQFFFESREPPNDEYSIDDLKADFPEGDYTISGV